MSYNSKRTIVSMAAGAILIAVYIIYVCMGKAPAPEDVRAWAKLWLVFIGIAIAVQIVIQILFHVVFSAGIAVKEHHKDDGTTKRIIDSFLVEDERDKLINLKSLRMGYICAGVGLMIALFALAAGASAVIALHIIIGASAAASLVEGCMGIFLHERGVRYG